jgi:hypothetical protein
MALSADIQIDQYGSPAIHQPIEYPIGHGASGQTIYRGSVAALSGGTTVTQGYLKNMATPASTDIVVGIIGDYGPSCGQPNVAPGLGGATLNTADGVLTATVFPGTYLLLAGGTAGDALTVTNVGTSVYLVNEDSVGATSATSTRPVAGLLVQVPATDASIPTGYVAVQLGTPSTPWGGV